MRAEIWAAAGTCSHYAAAAALSSDCTLPSPALLREWRPFRAIVSGSLRRQGQGLRGKDSCQFSLCEVRIVDLHHGGAANGTHWVISGSSFSLGLGSLGGGLKSWRDPRYSLAFTVLCR